MYNNYFFLEGLSIQLNEDLKGNYIKSIFSQNKNELIFETSASKVPFIKADLSSSFSCMYFPEKFNRAKKNSIDLFQEAVGLKVLKVRAVKYDRSFILELENSYSFLIMLYGTRSNLVLLKNDYSYVWFKSAYSEDLSLKQLNVFEFPDFQDFKEKEGDLFKTFPVFGKENINLLLKSSYDEKNIDEKWNSFQGLFEKLINSRTFTVIEDDNFNVKLSILGGVDTLNKTSYFSNPLEALNFFYVRRQSLQSFKSRKNKLNAKINSELKKINSSLQKQTSSIQRISQEGNYRKYADILMANMHNIQKGLKKVTLSDFEGNDIEIKLNPSKSITAIAENYYRKAKNQHIQIENLQNNISLNKKQQKKWLELKSQVEIAKSKDELPELLKSAGKQVEASSEFTEYSYMGYRIYVGRNAKNNDKVTFDVGTKNDLWLHVKDEKGSHVIIKEKPGQGFSKQVIEFAARIASYYSARRTDTLAPVIYTQRKYVRKKKGLPAGAVIVEREEVIMVEPGLPGTAD